MTPTPLILAAFNSNAAAIPGVDQFQTIIGYFAWGATALCIIGLLATGATMAVTYQRGGGENFHKLGAIAAGCLIIGSASTVAAKVLGFNLFTSTPTAIPGLDMVQTIIGYVAWVAGGFCVIGFIVAGAMFAHSWRHGGDHTARLGSVVAGCLVVGGAATLVAALI